MEFLLDKSLHRRSFPVKSLKFFRVTFLHYCYYFKDERFILLIPANSQSFRDLERFGKQIFPENRSHFLAALKGTLMQI